MKAMEVVTKMFDEFLAKTGKPVTEMSLDAELYDCLARELREQANIATDMHIDYIKVRGVKINRIVVQ